MQSPLNKVVFIQKVAAFAPLSLDSIIKLAYVNLSWADTIKNYSFHLFEARCDDVDVDACPEFDSEGEEIPGSTEDAFCSALKGNMIWLLNTLLSSKSFMKNHDNCISLVCEFSMSAEAATFVLDKIVQHGDTDEFVKSRLSFVYEDEQNQDCLMFLFSNESLTPEMTAAIFDKLVEVGGTDLIKTLLDEGREDLGRNIIMYLCDNENEEYDFCQSPEKVKLVLEKSAEIGGNDLIKTLLTAKDYHQTNCLTIVAQHLQSVEVLKFVLAKIVECGGTELLKNEVISANNNGWSVLTAVLMFDADPEVPKLISSVLWHLDLFKGQYELLKFTGSDISLKEKTGIESASWTPDAESIAEVKKILENSCA